MTQKHTPYLADIIIPHHDRDDLLEKCLATIPRDQFHVIVQSGGSFAENCNKGAKKAKTDNLIFLNDDTEIDATLLVALCEKKSDVVGLSQIIPNIPGVIYGLQCTIGPADTVQTLFAFDKGDVFLPSGYCFLMRRHMWEKLGGFFTGYRNGHEDVDLFLRAIERGATFAFVDAPGRHYHSQSSGRSDHIDRNAALFYQRWDKARCEKVLRKHAHVIYRDQRAQWKSDAASADRSDFYHLVRTHYFTVSTREVSCASVEDAVAAWDRDTYLTCTGVSLAAVHRALGRERLSAHACFAVVERANRIVKINPDAVPDVLAHEEHFALFIPHRELTMVSFVSHSANRYGAEKSLKDMIRHMVPHGIVPHVILPAHGFFVEDCTDLPISYDVTPLPWSTRAFTGDEQFYRSTIFHAAIAVASRIANVNTDLVVTSTSVIDEGALAARLLGIPHIWRVSEFGCVEHGIVFLDDSRDRLRFITDMADTVLFSSQALQAYYEEHVGPSGKYVVGGEMVEVMPPSADAQRFFMDENALKIVVVGNLAEGKGQHDAVSAVAAAIRRGSLVELALVGGEEDRDYATKVRTLVEKEGVSAQVHFVGYVKTVRDVYDQADVVLTCSVFEGFGRTPVEAMLCGKAVIGARSGATPELVRDGENGLLYAPGDVDALAAHIVHCAAHPDLVQRYGENGRAFVTRMFTKENYCATLQRVFATAQASRRGTITAVLAAHVAAMHAKGAVMDRVHERDAVIAQMHQSPFWKAKELYEKVRFALTQPQRFAAKYVSAGWARWKK